MNYWHVGVAFALGITVGYPVWAWTWVWCVGQLAAHRGLAYHRGPDKQYYPTRPVWHWLRPGRYKHYDEETRTWSKARDVREPTKGECDTRHKPK